jgi:DNA-binding HxlR family transcriptional regulator
VRPREGQRAMVKRTSFEEADCPVARSLDMVGDWWSLLIVRDAFDGVRRFSDFQKGLGVSKGILAVRLRELVARGVLEMTPASDGTAYQDYMLTEKGRDLFPVIVALRQWGEHHCFLPGERHSMLVENETGKPVGRLELRSRRGRPLTSADTTVRKVAPRTPLSRVDGPRRVRARNRRHLPKIP